jgi:TFIIH basal transcription factor complex TTD-A subunit
MIQESAYSRVLLVLDVCVEATIYAGRNKNPKPSRVHVIGRIKCRRISASRFLFPDRLVSLTCDQGDTTVELWTSIDKVVQLATILKFPRFLVTMPKATPGTMIQCDPAIIAIIEKLNEENERAFIQTRLDDEHLLIPTEKMNELKGLLNAVSSSHHITMFSAITKRSCSGA